MAYAAVYSITPLVISRRRHYLLELNETDGAAASQAEIKQSSDYGELPRIGTIVSVKATKTTGAAATLDPRAGRTTGWADSTNDAIYANGAAAAHIDSSPGSTFALVDGQSIFWKSTPDSGTNNVIATEILIVEGFINT